MNELAPPFTGIRRSLHAGRVIPFLGAGASRLSSPATPDPDAEDATAPNPPDDATVQGSPHRPSRPIPSARKLQNELAKLCNFPKDDTSADLAKVAQFCDVVLGSSELRHNLLHLFDHDQPPSSLHRYLAAIEHPLLIVTTNYDDLIEQAFREAGREFHLVVHASIAGKRRHVLWRPPSSETYEAVPTKTFELEVDEHPVIYKMHGSCDVEDSMAQRHFVITEDDYADFLGRMNSNAAIPNAFAEPFRERSFLFLGYSLNDWNLRVVLSQIRSQLAGSATNWAIQRDVAPVEREIWRQRNVRIYDMTIDALVEGLSR